MGRTNGKLIPFLMTGLTYDRYRNLKYEDNIKREVFYIEFPRYDKTKPLKNDEHLLKDWYKFNGKDDKYESYSTAKAVFQASLKKSLYLTPLPKVGTKLRFRFASPEEIKGKKEREKAQHSNSTSSVVVNSPITNPDNYCAVNETQTSNSVGIDDSFYMTDLSSVGSSGYGSDETEEGFHSPALSDIPAVLDNYFCSNNESSLEPDLDLLLDEYLNINETDNPLLENTKVDASLDLLNLDEQDSPSGVLEMNAIPVDVSEFLRPKTYWLCNKKINLDATFLLICEKQVLDLGSQISEGTIVIPSGVWERGISYDLKKSLELDDKLFLFLSPSV